MKRDDPEYYLGIDIGSVTSKAVLLDQRANMVTSMVMFSGTDLGRTSESLLDTVLRSSRINEKKIRSAISTGYGRRSVAYATRDVSEISCHAVGVKHLFPSARSIIDIGGQDSKAILMNQQGKVIDFIMNDKCAAGTGRFLEVMARVLEVGITELADLSATADQDVQISNTCTVFAESEVISLLSQGVAKENLAKAVHNAIARRALGMARRIGILEPLVLTGGVARNKAIIAAIRQASRMSEILVPRNPQVTGALGAALLALRAQQ